MDETKKPRLRWRKQPRETGLAATARVGREYGYDFWYGDTRIASARALYGRYPMPDVTGYYWSCPTDKERGIALRNTCDNPVPTMEGAKAACEDYIRECLKFPARKVKKGSV